MLPAYSMIVSMLIHHYVSFISVRSALLLKSTYETHYMVLIYPPCSTHMAEAQIPLLPVDIATWAKFIQEGIAIMGLKGLLYYSAWDMPSLLNHIHSFGIPDLEKSSYLRNFLFVVWLFYLISWSKSISLYIAKLLISKL